MDVSEQNYWNRTGKYQAELDHMVEMFVPMSGKCDTVAGELIRAASRLGYDFYNNGMGNNTSGAVNYLSEKGAIDSRVYDDIHGYTRGRLYNGRYGDDRLHRAMVLCVDQTIEFILNNPELKTEPNADDMFDFEEEEERFCEECGDSLDDTRGWFCEYCEDEQYA